MAAISLPMLLQPHPLDRRHRQEPHHCHKLNAWMVSFRRAAHSHQTMGRKAMGLLCPNSWARAVGHLPLCSTTKQSSPKRLRARGPNRRTTHPARELYLWGLPLKFQKANRSKKGYAGGREGLLAPQLATQGHHTKASHQRRQRVSKSLRSTQHAWDQKFPEIFGGLRCWAGGRRVSNPNRVPIQVFEAGWDFKMVRNVLGGPLHTKLGHQAGRGFKPIVPVHPNTHGTGVVPSVLGKGAGKHPLDQVNEEIVGPQGQAADSARGHGPHQPPTHKNWWGAGHWSNQTAREHASTYLCPTVLHFPPTAGEPPPGWGPPSPPKVYPPAGPFLHHALKLAYQLLRSGLVSYHGLPLTTRWAKALWAEPSQPHSLPCGRPLSRQGLEPKWLREDHESQCPTPDWQWLCLVRLAMDSPICDILSTSKQAAGQTPHPPMAWPVFLILLSHTLNSQKLQSQQEDIWCSCCMLIISASFGPFATSQWLSKDITSPDRHFTGWRMHLGPTNPATVQPTQMQACTHSLKYACE